MARSGAIIKEYVEICSLEFEGNSWTCGFDKVLDQLIDQNSAEDNAPVKLTDHVAVAGIAPLLRTGRGPIELWPAPLGTLPSSTPTRLPLSTS